MSVEISHSGPDLFLVGFCDSGRKIIRKFVVFPTVFVPWPSLAIQNGLPFFFCAIPQLELFFSEDHVTHLVVSIFIFGVVPVHLILEGWVIFDWWFLLKFFNGGILSCIWGSLGGKLPLKFFD